MELKKFTLFLYRYGTYYILMRYLFNLWLIQVIIAARNEKKAQDAIQRIVKERASAKLSFLHLDLSSFDSVLQFTKRLKIVHPVADYVVLNAGVFGLPYKLTDDGLEYIMQVYYNIFLNLLYLQQQFTHLVLVILGYNFLKIFRP